MSAAARSPRSARVLFWTLAALVLPLLNPALALLGAHRLGEPGWPVTILAIAVANFVALGAAGRRAWPDPRELRPRRIAAMLLAAALTVPAIWVDLVIWLLIASLGCPPNAYECPV